MSITRQNIKAETNSRELNQSDLEERFNRLKSKTKKIYINLNLKETSSYISSNIKAELRSFYKAVYDLLLNTPRSNTWIA